MTFPDFPPQVDPRKDIYKPLPLTADVVDWKTIDATDISTRVLRDIAEILSQDKNDSGDLEVLFRKEGSFWRDTLALTAHIRTFSGPSIIGGTLRQLGDARGVNGFILTKKTSLVVSASPETSWVDCSFTFRTAEPQARCQGKMMLVPEDDSDGTVRWKIWSLATMLLEFEGLPEDVGRLTSPSPAIPAASTALETDVLIVGAGNAGLVQAARLKALGIDHLVVEKNARAGDNWSNRYDYLRFHIGKNYCQVPYLPYPRATNYMLTRNDLRDHMQRFADEFDLDKRSTSYDDASRTWAVGTMILATGLGYSVPRVPEIADKERFAGPHMHSHHFRNGAHLKAQGVRSVIVDCHSVGLQVTMVQRSPILIIPMAYYEDPQGLGVFDYVSTSTGDAMFMMGALQVGGELSRQGHAARARAEPNRYKAAIEAGFRVKDCTQTDLLGLLLTSAGRFMVDMERGAMDLIASGVVKVVPGSPAAHTSSGLQIDDGRCVEGDAIVWCTGYNTDAREELAGILGDGWEKIAAKLEATMGLDVEGELRGMYKRIERQERLWILGGGTAQHRWYSRMIALQVQGVLEGILPDAFRD
ncbi:hypothetical protein F5X68DRAFT_243654 [Plectosphaerella plurivora]|uniref:FAD-binding domain-containing protein n=1 Tax=Plectosphaerella plurivora TaxID=936078 RepID=A0A9P9AG28_9PEZI|nr:hypothetical protein F5X68DRAFT_243654 [Plectosphaerella plurivora]